MILVFPACAFARPTVQVRQNGATLPKQFSATFVFVAKRSSFVNSPGLAWTLPSLLVTSARLSYYSS